MSKPTMSIRRPGYVEPAPTRISDVIAELRKIQDARGDLVVQAYSYSSPSYLPARVAVASDSEDAAFVLIEP